MTEGTEFTALLDLLEEIPEIADDVDRRGTATSPETPTDQRQAVLRRLRTDPEARMTLFRLALEVKRGATDSEEDLRAELRAFAAAVEDRFDVDLLRTAAARRDRLRDVPEGLLEGPAVDPSTTDPDRDSGSR